MRPSKRPIIIATRSSPLAQRQSKLVADVLQRLNPKIQVKLLPLESEGDQRADESLAQVGGKGLFTRAIELALQDGRADVAVHSYKDLPVRIVPGLVVAATPNRGPVQDALISPVANSIMELPHGTLVGTCSFRRAAQLRRLRPDLRIEPLRGNIETRIRKVLGEGGPQATLLAAAGLRRAGLGEHASKLISLEEMLPAASQAALAIQCRADDHVTIRRLLPMNNAAAATEVELERAIVEGLAADCTAPLAVLAEHTGDRLIRLRVRVLSPEGDRCIEVDQTAPLKSIKHLTRDVLAELILQGAPALLGKARTG